MTRAPTWFAPLTEAAGDYAAALARLEDATREASAAWSSLPHAIVAPGADDAAHRWVLPAASAAEGLAGSAVRLHSTLLGAADDVRRLSARASTEPDDPSWDARIDASLAGWAAAVAAIRGGELDGRTLPDVAVSGAGGTSRPTAFTSTSVPVTPTATAWLSELLEGAGGAAETGGALLGVGALLALAGLVILVPGSTDTSPMKAHTTEEKQAAQRERNRRALITPYAPCSPFTNEGCQPFEAGKKPGDDEYTGDKVKGDEPPGVMRGTKADWTQEPTRNEAGYIYKPPGAEGEEGSIRVVDRSYKPKRYPNGYVQFKNADGQVIDLKGEPVDPKTGDAHIPRYPDGDFPLPEGWGE